MVQLPPPDSLRHLALYIREHPEKGDVPVDTPIGHLDDDQIATIVWQRIGNDPDGGITALAGKSGRRTRDIEAWLVGEADREVHREAHRPGNYVLELVLGLLALPLLVLLVWGAVRMIA